MLLMIWGACPLRFFRRYLVHLLGLGVPHHQLRGCKQHSDNTFRVFSNTIHPNAYIKVIRVHDNEGVLQPKTFQNDLDCLLCPAVSINPTANRDSTEAFPSRITQNPLSSHRVGRSSIADPTVIGPFKIHG